MGIKKTIFLIVIASVMSGCASKEGVVVYKEVTVPVRCDASMPVKPHFDGTFESAKQKRVYWGKIEELLRQCIGDE